MKDVPATQRAAVTSRRSGSSSEDEERFFLVRALDVGSETASASRHSLENVEEVRIGRGMLAPARVTEGSRRILTLRTPDHQLSANHARLSWDRGAWQFEDLGSTNGSVVAGNPVSQHELSDGDVIELGATVFLFRRILSAPGVAEDRELQPLDAGDFATLCPALEHSMVHMERIAASRLSVLLLGETGTGKDVLARRIHRLSKRPGAFVAVNCGGIPSTLMEAQLFGHTKGAFTGAVKDELGFVRAAHDGTLFLDEIADLPLASQAALLRVLQSGEVTPVGSVKTEHVNVRVIAATHRDLETLMTASAFRQDLYARLAGFVSVIPPLRDRPEDIGPLVRLMLARHSHGEAPPVLKMDAARTLFTYSWPLNVRELEQCVAAAMVLSEDGVIRRNHLPSAVRTASRSSSPSGSPAPFPAPLPLSPEDEATRDALIAALRETSGNVSETARRLGKARQQIQRWLRRFEIDPATFQD